jgi:RNA polymerase sigma-70 factor (ECF subfamily)
MIENVATKDASDAEDIEKVREFLGGNPAAFEFLFDKYRDKVFGVAFRFVNDREDALEVTQEVFLRVHQALRRFRTDSKFFTWLYRITVNRSIDYLRSRRSHPVVEFPRGEEGEDLGDAVPDPRGVDPHRALEDRELGEQLLAAIGELSSKHRAVFLLHAVEQLPYREIAEVLGCSIGTVMSRLFYARKRLQQHLAKKGVI